MTVGFNPYNGMDVFEFRGKRTGLLPALLDDIHKALGVRLALARVTTWDEAYNGFLKGDIDILYGANPTPERERVMAFTVPVLRYPYADVYKRQVFLCNCRCPSISTPTRCLTRSLQKRTLMVSVQRTSVR